MKIRNGFVSNSSSSSFIVDLSKIKKIKKRRKIAKKIFSCKYDDQEWGDDESDRWSIEQDGDIIEGFTYMDNYDFPEYILKVFRKVIGGKRWKEIYDECVTERW